MRVSDVGEVATDIGQRMGSARAKLKKMVR